MGRSEQLAHEGLQLCETHGCNLLASGLWIGKAMVAAGRGDWDTARTLTDTMERWAVPRRALCGMCWNSSKQLSVRIGARRQSRKRCSARSPALRSFRHDWHLYRLEVRVSPLRMSKPPSSSGQALAIPEVERWPFRPGPDTPCLRRTPAPSTSHRRSSCTTHRGARDLPPVQPLP
jgi:hypothetical protein